MYDTDLSLAKRELRSVAPFFFRYSRLPGKDCHDRFPMNTGPHITLVLGAPSETDLITSADSQHLGGVSTVHGDLQVTKAVDQRQRPPFTDFAEIAAKPPDVHGPRAKMSERFIEHGRAYIGGKISETVHMDDLAIDTPIRANRFGEVEQHRIGHFRSQDL